MTVIDTPLRQQSRPAQVTQILRGSRRGQPALVTTSPAEATRTPGLVITPRLAHDLTGAWSFTGEWQVRHQSSGQLVGPGWQGAALGHARDLAALLADLDVDWTRPREELPLGDFAVRTVVGEVHEQIERAIHEARPARMLETSWRELPPPYWVGPEAGCSDLAFPTFSEAADFVTEDDLTGFVLDGDDLADHFVGREPAPVWELYCAALDCRRELADGEIGWLFYRSDLAREARGEGWRRLDQQRWLCASCSALFIRHRPQ